MSATPRTQLLGRRREAEILCDLVDRTRHGAAAVCVVRGEAGIGKSTLLDHVAVHASDLTVVRAQGVQADMDLAFAGVHQLCAPFLGQLGDLPSPQRDALQVAFGLVDGQAPDRFLVGLAVLSLLTASADARPLVVIVDDAQWLDRVSLQTLEFVSRRLLAEPVAVVFAVRHSEGEPVLADLPSLEVGGLDDHAARQLLASAVHGPIDDQVRDRIVAETHGNPLALLELPRGRSAADLAYGFEIGDAGSVSTRVERDYAQRLAGLPRPTRLLLLLAAADPVGDASLLARAAGHVGITADAAPAKAAGLLEFGESVRFRHPLARSAVYRDALPDELRQVHRALSLATDPVQDPDRRAWHAAKAGSGPDEEVAAALESSAERARLRGGMAAEAALLDQAARSTPDPRRRGRRALAAGEAYVAAASPDAASELAGVAVLCPLSAQDQARLVRLRARVLFARSRSDEAAPLLLDAAAAFASEGSPLARETYLEAISATVFSGRVHGPAGAQAAAIAARDYVTGVVGAPSSPPAPSDLLLEGVTTLLADGLPEGAPLLRRALGPFADEEPTDREATQRWLALAPVAQETYVHQLWDFAAWTTLAARMVRVARDVGALGVLPQALQFEAGVHLHRGDLAAAARLIAEGDAISRATGSARLTYAALVLAAWRGEEADATRILDEARESATVRGEVSLLGVSGHVEGVLYNGLARYDRALDGARAGIEHDGFNFTGWALAEHVEAAVRCGEDDLAAESLRRLTERTARVGTGWAQGMRARCEALLRAGDEADRLYEAALEHLRGEGITVQVARTHLLYGEWLRRTKRRALAREHLRAAHELLHAMGADAFAERARRELRATGESARPSDDRRDDPLTPQESQIAALAAEGMTNPEIGAELYLSPHTVEWHLRKVFAKLGIGSRRHLRDALTSGTAARP
ncbi:AAA family ATPase [Mumia sp. zg.B21]|uniref:ATP-binding protein n=1 Tax=Mumia sp. zg.B21 TaxID=2855447 RepID=UPI001C6ED3AA|nr:LuxR family transcriptional regulator [Mumia sp. zg.B21]MBW9208204.1 AAA family ATPase [Mumia sp. zg.B21]